MVAPPLPLPIALGDLVLRRWEPAHADSLLRAWQDPVIAATCAVPAQPSLALATAWIGGWSSRLRSGRALDLVVTGADDDEVRAEVGLAHRPRPLGPAEPIGRPDVFELGWWVHAEHRRKGIAVAATLALTDWAVAALAPDRLMARISGANVAAEKVARAVGLAPLGVPTSAPRLWAFPG